MTQRVQGSGPSICLNMIVRNEAHVITELLDSVAPYIQTWVIVDTGSEDGTQDIIRRHMARLGIPGELHERPWRNFGHNRSESLALAQGRADYIWVMDADDVLVGTFDLSDLKCDVASMRIESPGVSYWRMQIFRDGLPFHYEGVVHEYATCDMPFTSQRLYGDYVVHSRRLGGRNMDPQKYHRDIELLLAEIERNAEDSRSVFYLARSYNSLADWHNARAWYEKRTEMGGWEEEIFYSLWRIATAIEMLGEPADKVQEAYLRAWEYRPTRAEPLHDLASYFRRSGNFSRGHLFAERAASIPMPQDDALFINPEVYKFRSLDEQAVCASGLGRNQEALRLCRRLLTIRDLPDLDQRRISKNRNAIALALIEWASSFPAELVSTLKLGTYAAEVTVILTGRNAAATQRTLNSFLNCCLDAADVGRFLIVDEGFSETDRAHLGNIYPFAELSGPGSADTSPVHTQVGGQYWLHLDEGWQFGVPETLIGRLTEILQTESDVFAVGLNLGDSNTFATNDEIADPTDKKGSGYVLTKHLPAGPTFYDTSRTERYWKGELGLRTASLDEVFCVTDR